MDEGGGCQGNGGAKAVAVMGEGRRWRAVHAMATTAEAVKAKALKVKAVKAKVVKLKVAEAEAEVNFKAVEAGKVQGGDEGDGGDGGRWKQRRRR